MTSILSFQEHKDPRLRTYFLRRRLYWPITEADEHPSFSKSRRRGVPTRNDASAPAYRLASYLLSLPAVRLVKPSPFHVAVRVASARHWSVYDTIVRRAIDAAIRGENLEPMQQEQLLPVLAPAR